MKKPVGRLHVITDTHIQRRLSHVQLAELALAGGADSIQFRAKNMDPTTMIETAKALRSVCASAAVPLIINDRVDVALAADADGVHLGQEDLPIEVARRVLGPSRLIGGSASTLEAALRVEAEGADYVGFGHVFPTASKHKPTPAKGVETLREICDALRIPVIAIGGIDAGNAWRVVESGAWGVAVIAAVCGADDPRGAAARLKDVLDQGQQD